MGFAKKITYISCLESALSIQNDHKWTLIKTILDISPDVARFKVSVGAPFDFQDLPLFHALRVVCPPQDNQNNKNSDSILDLFVQTTFSEAINSFINADPKACFSLSSYKRRSALHLAALNPFVPHYVTAKILRQNPSATSMVDANCKPPLDYLLKYSSTSSYDENFMEIFDACSDQSASSVGEVRQQQQSYNQNPIIITTEPEKKVEEIEMNRKRLILKYRNDKLKREIDGEIESIKERDKAVCANFERFLSNHNSNNNGISNRAKNIENSERTLEHTNKKRSLPDNTILKLYLLANPSFSIEKYSCWLLITEERLMLDIHRLKLESRKKDCEFTCACQMIKQKLQKINERNLDIYNRKLDMGCQELESLKMKKNKDIIVPSKKQLETEKRRMQQDNQNFTHMTREEKKSYKYVCTRERFMFKEKLTSLYSEIAKQKKRRICKHHRASDISMQVDKVKKRTVDACLLEKKFDKDSYSLISYFQENISILENTNGELLTRVNVKRNIKKDKQRKILGEGFVFCEEDKIVNVLDLDDNVVLDSENDFGIYGRNIGEEC